MDGPPPLVDDSSDDGSIHDATQRRRRCPNDRSPGQQRFGFDGAVSEGLSSSNGDEYGEGSDDDYVKSESESDDETLIPDRAEVEQAAAFALNRLRRSQQGLEAWDHADFVRMLDQSVAHPSSWMPMVVMQEAQVRAFAYRATKSVLNFGHNRQPSGIVRNVEKLGTLRHLRDARLLPFNTACECLYTHPGVEHLLNECKPRGSFPRLMHINPEMSGPVQFFSAKNIVTPVCVAFAGAEFFVKGSATIEKMKYWHVVVELGEAIFDVSKTEVEGEGPVMPELEGLPAPYRNHGTRLLSGYVPCITEDMPTLLDGSAPMKMDRIKAFHMDPCYHAISHRVWGLEDVRMFLLILRLLMMVGPLILAILWRKAMVVLVVVALLISLWMMEMDDHELVNSSLLLLYHSTPGRILVRLICLVTHWHGYACGVLMLADSTVRLVIFGLLWLSSFVLPNQFYSVVLRVLRFAVDATRWALMFLMGMYAIAMEEILRRLPAGIIAKAFAFIHGIIEVIVVSAALLFRFVASAFYWWQHLYDDPLVVELEDEYRQLLGERNERSDRLFLSLVRKWIMGLRTKDTRAAQHRLNAEENGADYCVGKVRFGPYGCSAGLAVAADKAGARPSRDARMTALTMLTKSGIVCDSLIRTARAMLGTNCSRSATVHEVSHQLMHAVQQGLTWPDEYFVGKSLADEGRNLSVENIDWTRAKWILSAAQLIVDGESLPPGFTPPWVKASLQQAAGKDYRNSGIHPAVRCVLFHMESEGRSHAADVAHHMKHRAEIFSGSKHCKSTAEKIQPTPDYDQFDDADTCVVAIGFLANPRAGAKFPFYHAAARQTTENRRTRLYAARATELEKKAARLVRADADVTRKRRPPPKAKRRSSNHTAPDIQVPLPPPSKAQSETEREHRLAEAIRRHENRIDLANSRKELMKKEIRLEAEAERARERTDLETLLAGSKAKCMEEKRRNEALRQELHKIQQHKLEALQKEIRKASRKEVKRRAAAATSATNARGPAAVNATGQTVPRGGGARAKRRADKRRQSDKKGSKSQMRGVQVPVPTVSQVQQAEQQRQASAPRFTVGESRSASYRKAAADERKGRRTQAKMQRASKAEAARQERLRALASDLKTVLEVPPTNTMQKSGDEEHEGPRGEEQDDDGDMCIVCMTEKRSACLVHGRTAHQIVCVPCGDRLKEANVPCPLCNRAIDAVIQNFS